MPAPSKSKQDDLNAIFAALSDPTRRAMLKRLSRGEATVNDLAAPFKMSLPAISKHIKVLEAAGLLTKTIQKQQRPCKLNSAKLKQAIDWITATNLIAPQANKTQPTAQNDQIKTEAIEPSQVKVKKPKNTKRSDDDPQSQPQIGFDF